jgi:hypothetical protein
MKHGKTVRVSYDGDRTIGGRAAHEWNYFIGKGKRRLYLRLRLKKGAEPDLWVHECPAGRRMR